MFVNPKSLITLLKVVKKNAPLIIATTSSVNKAIQNRKNKSKPNTVPSDVNVKLKSDSINADLTKHTEELRTHVKVLNGHTNIIKKHTAMLDAHSSDIENSAELMGKLALANQQVSSLIRFMFLSFAFLCIISITALLLAIFI